MTWPRLDGAGNLLSCVEHRCPPLDPTRLQMKWAPARARRPTPSQGLRAGQARIRDDSVCTNNNENELHDVREDDMHGRSMTCALALSLLLAAISTANANP